MLSNLKLFITLGLLIRVLSAEIVFVAELFRHGARSPSTIRLNSSRKWDVPESSLTANGAYMHYQLGSYMRKIYIEQQKLLSPTYNEEEIIAISSHTSRTVQSAYAHLMGLYPPKTGGNVTNPDLNGLLPYNYSSETLGNNTPALPYNYQTIPVYTFSKDDDNILHGYTGKSCPNAKDIQEDAENTTDYIEMEKRLNKTFLPLAPILGVNESELNLKFVKQIFSELHCAYFEGHELPVKPHSDLWNMMWFVYDFSNIYQMTYDPLAHKAYVSAFLKDLRDVMLDAANASSPLKLKIYSSHDYQMINVLHHFGLMSWECLADRYFNGSAAASDTPCLRGPEFGAQIIWELHRKGGEYYVLMKYNNQSYNICGSSEAMCPLKSFVGKLEEGFIGPKMHDVVCRSAEASIRYPSIVSILVGLLSILGMCFAIIKVWEKTKKKAHERFRTEEVPAGSEMVEA
mgnify:FL=1